jgi:hypothetical protein
MVVSDQNGNWLMIAHFAAFAPYFGQDSRQISNPAVGSSRRERLRAISLQFLAKWSGNG